LKNYQPQLVSLPNFLNHQQQNAENDWHWDIYIFVYTQEIPNKVYMGLIIKGPFPKVPSFPPE